MSNAAIIVAAGRGLRAGTAGGKPKQYIAVGGRPVLARSLSVFLDHRDIGWVQPVIHADDHALYAETVAGLDSSKLLPPVDGGDNRQQSVLNGLRALQSVYPQNVLIHDAARPFVTSAIISRVLAALSQHKACLAAIPVSDTLKAEANGLVCRTVERAGLWRAQTPQGFDFGAILAAHEAAAREGLANFTDDAAIAEWRGMNVALAPGAERNIKLTTPEDFALAEHMFSSSLQPSGLTRGEAVEQGKPLQAACGGSMLETRNGTGFDVHAFEPGDHVMLCGVRVPHEARLKGHSDADVGLHALTDALLGAIGAGDIGQHFPPSEERWRNADSAVFLERAGRLVEERGGRIINADVTLICERPKIGPYREAMRARIGAILGIAAERVSVKATTTEGLGFTGRGEGIAAMASATVAMPPSD